MRWIRGGCLFLTLLWLVSLSQAAERKDSYADKIEQEKKTLEKLRGTIVEKRKKADEAEKKRESVLQGLQSLDERLVRYRQEHQDIVKKLKRKDLEIEQMSVQLSRLSERIDERQDAIAARLRVQYVEGRFWHLKTLLAASSAGDFQRRFRYLSAVTQREYEIMETYRRDAERIAEVERNREEARQGILAYKVTTEDKLAQIQGLKKQKRVYLAKITQEKESHDRAVEELERSATRVDSLLKELEARRRAALASRPPSAGGGLRALRGTLLWPTDGQVVSYFGRQKHPTFNTYIQRKGIEIRAAEGSNIRSVLAGQVVYADWLKGYGLVIIMDHANGVFSLYAHASKILTSVGARIEAGEAIGETGDTGMTGENTLYFELREGAEPVDPLVWLSKR
ncbi:MAG TPA: peptidoglycan DD-metalloendopeptidase family protein [Nitrospira sp.]|jgi:septal ring factor EnvC (AmiA/AmiB activator)|nr:peptidoglycan DD-metalloendopeptidase family protein [Nitrospira sp.]MCC7470447.1 peptidoglycan DD-metalloendopeptidase family protein [Candidatus Nomurabacteria bacterium]MBS0157836.1 peptidoglycan DD-metalloendopeptidase family protein [Nitrospira sp.]MBS0163741.1 peptidoglycan DD-metalloendopeptidase family protein [Nitrospira sp.]MBS0176298.1 peptidoglycan DD-metalloendopeptidase family protein [Nitrospira sp.]